MISYKLNNLKINSTSYQEVLDLISDHIENFKKHKKPLIVSTPNPEIALLAQKNKDIADFINNSDVSAPDGIGLLWKIKRQSKNNKILLIKGRVLFEKILEISDLYNYKIFLLGASQSSNEKSVNKIKKLYKKLDIKSYWDIKVDNKGYLISDENTFKQFEIESDILFVALGAPKQELFIKNYLDKLNAKVIITIGGTLDVFSENLNMPPKIIENLNLEWLFRLYQEPKRIGRIIKAIWFYLLS